MAVVDRRRQVTCQHERKEYCVQADMGGMVMVRDYMKCLDCNAEYSLVRYQWELTEMSAVPNAARLPEVGNE